MTPIQKSIVYSWSLVLFSVVIIYLFYENELALIVAGFILAPLYSYFRGKFDTGYTIFRLITNKAKMLLAIYYLIWAIVILYLVLVSPEIIDYGSRNQFFLLLAIIIMPILIISLRQEILIFRNENLQSKT